ncbi:hypothetical protein V499_08450 [Pseudogymnoascus sp. VKM F-103]|nr:hypothetical protein V499_08450 [Pseudogymnoascus sp. VKM F-103]
MRRNERELRLPPTLRIRIRKAKPDTAFIPHRADAQPHLSCLEILYRGRVAGERHDARHPDVSDRDIREDARLRVRAAACNGGVAGELARCDLDSFGYATEERGEQ